MRERIVIVFVAIAIGLIVTTLVFFLYQQTKTLPDTITRSETNNQNQNTIAENNVTLIIEEPTDEALSERRTIEVKGKTDIGNVIVVSTNQEDVIANPTNDGDFSVTIEIDAGVNKIITRAIAPNGDMREEVRIITFNTEEF